jgi:hypothetical protein
VSWRVPGWKVPGEQGGGAGLGTGVARRGLGSIWRGVQGLAAWQMSDKRGRP